MTTDARRDRCPDCGQYIRKHDCRAMADDTLFDYRPTPVRVARIDAERAKLFGGIRRNLENEFIRPDWKRVLPVNNNGNSPLTWEGPDGPCEERHGTQCQCPKCVETNAGAELRRGAP